ncbi:hypothetical protein [Plesiomonas shigelloides]|uniref:hypothetical protein n=1 Tax=Plesiomonas shigelloides TaxID=703 RepID=UPI001261CE8F|nr:hypothetical protein [Plesiomonas shigelloides]KAB7674504.1 hypothetical protein GBN23_13880 [Plesiomonas shigelloides]MCQ8860058.1 hypothetical protein [Plesiomonas shigelloides]
MAWQIKWNGYSIGYTYRNESFEINDIYLKNRKIRQEPSSGYKEPDDDVMEDIYYAESEHGIFEWLVIARRSGFDGYAVIEDIYLLSKPEGCDSEAPSFEIYESNST